MTTTDAPATQQLLERVDFLRLDATRRLEPDRRVLLGQFFTPPETAALMATMLLLNRPCVRLLDLGAGIGSLTAAAVAEACARPEAARPREIIVTAYELDPLLVEYLTETVRLCNAVCQEAGIAFSAEVLREDVIEAGAAMFSGSMFDAPRRSYDTAILNPPYRKIHSESRERRWLRAMGLETTNLYSGFLAVATRLLAPGGEMVAITPRSFTNGLYFRPFRTQFLRTMTVRRIHIFDQRDQAFRDDAVLQENIVLHAVRLDVGPGAGILPAERLVTITSSVRPDDPVMTERLVRYEEFVQPRDPESFMHIVPDDLGDLVAARMASFTASLTDLGLTVSTGRVVDFRAADDLRDLPGHDTAPLIYPTHISEGLVSWPRLPARKPNALRVRRETESLLVPPGWYVLVKRFSAKEERRRVVAALYDPSRMPAGPAAFENHLNYYHAGGTGLSEAMAKGLAAFLNSTLVDAYFRQFNGHTQVNATDLRSFRYPSRAALEAIGARIGDTMPVQHELDQIIDRELFSMAETPDPAQVKRRVDEAISILKSLGLPKEQQNERSALVFLALTDLTPDNEWAMASAARRGITQMMEFMREHYGKRYAPNTRETIRRQTVHQFRDAGIVILNPDDPKRPINSGKTVYELSPDLLSLLRLYGSVDWEPSLRTYLASADTLARRYAQEREMERIPVQIASGQQITLSPGGQNVLIEQIIHEFCPRFTPGGKIVYVGDTDEKWGYFDSSLLAALGVSFDPHGKMPDVVVYHEARGWLVLIEAVTSHGPVDPKRRAELQELFGAASAEPVYVTAFLDRRAMMEYLGKIAWETEVWVADAPSHMIHFNGERFLGSDV